MWVLRTGAREQKLSSQRIRRSSLEGGGWRGSCWGVLARVLPGNRKDARLALMREACRLTSRSGLTHLASDLKSSLASLQHMNLGSESIRSQPDSKILLCLAINLKSGDIPSGPTAVLNYTASPQPAKL